MPKHGMRSRFWLFTINNPTALVTYQDFNDEARYLIFQEEIGKEGTYHLQGYVEMITQKSLLAMKKYLPQAHWERRMGTQEQAIDYCSKYDTSIGGPYISGEPSKGQGFRKDLIELKSDIDKGMSMKQIADKHFSAYIRYHKGIEKVVAFKVPEKNWKTPITVVIGESGSGKTYWVQNTLFKKETVYWKDGSKWWPNYQGHETAVVFDEFVGCWSPYELNKMYDPVPYWVEVKGTHMPWLVKQIAIISNYNPKSWWSKAEYWNAFERRVERWVFCFKRTSGVNKVYDRTEFTSWDKFEEHLQKNGVVNKPSKEDK